MSNNDVYGQLVDILQSPGSTRLRLILEHLMTPDQARMVLALPGTPAEVAEKTGFDATRVKESLEELFYKGAIVPRGDLVRRERYRFHRHVGSFHDNSAASALLDVEKDRKFFELWYDYVMNEMYPASAESMKLYAAPVDRIIPAYKAIKDLDGILPYENFPEMLKAQERIAVVPCSCRLITESVGLSCDVHDEVEHWACILFGRSAEYAATRGSGRELTIEEALELNDVIEENGLLHKWGNNSSIVGPGVTCQCCRDCCMMTVPIDITPGMNIGQIWAKSRYEAYVIQEDCTGCQDCVDRCLFDAIEMVKTEGSKKLKAVVDPEKCFGCGVCVLVCETAALKMKTVRPPEHIPAPMPRR